MKKYILFIVVLFSTTFYAQLDRRIGGQQPMNIPREQAKPLDPVEASLQYLKKELSLDAFQEAAIKVLLTDHNKYKNRVLAEDITDSEKVEKLKSKQETLDKQIEAVLNENQVKLFEKIKEKTNPEKKKKKS